MASPTEKEPETFVKLSLSPLLKLDAPIIVDGALATYLESAGADISSALWSAQLLIDDPDLIYRAHLEYYRAGANVVITASYQASFAGLRKYSNLSDNEVAEVVKKSVDLAIRARNDYLHELEEGERKRKEGKLFVAGSVGPYGAFLADGSEYRGDYSLSKKEMKDFHRGRVQELIRAGVDVLACETIPSFPEAEALSELLDEEFPEKPAWFSFTMKSEDQISDGTPLSRVVDLLNKSNQTVAIGANCIAEPLAMSVLKTLSGLTTKPLVVYPNSGELWDAEKRAWYGQRTEGSQLKQLTLDYWEAGARLVGGCCRTTPKDIRVIAEALRTV